MTLNSQQYANLVVHGDGEERDGKKGQMEHMVGKKVDLEGVTYKVLEYMDKPSGYQGAIYQRVDTGSDFGREPIEDDAVGDHFSEVRMHASKHDVALVRSVSVHRMHHSSFQEA